MGYTHALNGGAMAVGGPTTCSELVMKGFMPICIRHPDKNTASTQLPENSPVSRKAILCVQASYAAIAAVFRVLCRSI